MRASGEAPRAYGGQAHLYDPEYATFDQDVAFFRQRLLAADVRGPLLELGTGTGRVALPLVRAGWEVHGVDVSEAMLRRARARRARLPAAERARLHLSRQDVTQMRVPGRFAAVLAPFGLLTLLPDAAARAACLRACRAHLSTGGRLWVDVAAATPQGPAERSFTSRFKLPRGGRLVEKHTVQRRVSDGVAVEIEYHYRELAADGETELDRFVVAFVLQIVDEATLIDEVEAAGFELLELFGDWKGGPSTRESPRSIIEARAR
jgi:SAM-dependent methyltransferase